MGTSSRMIDAMNGLQTIIPGGTFVLDPLTAKHLKELEGFKTKEDFRQWLLARIKKPQEEFRLTLPPTMDLVVVGGEWNPMFMTTDFVYTQTVSIDKWIPRKGIRSDEKPIRMPSPVSCKDGSCGIR